MESEDISEETIRYENEVSIDIGRYTVRVRNQDWTRLMTMLHIGELKARVATQSEPRIIYDFDNRKWGVVFGESKMRIVSRLALALLFHFPERISRKILALEVDTKPDTLRQYLVNPPRGIKSYIEENSSGIVLGKEGFTWALGILMSFEEDNKIEGASQNETTE